MKEERLAILSMLERKIITAEEAERLLLALQQSGSSEGVGTAVNGAITKAGSALNAFAKVLGEKADEYEPTVRKVSDKVSEKAAVLFEDAKTYAQKLKEKREQQEEAEQNMEDDGLTKEDLEEVQAFFEEDDDAENQKEKTSTPEDNKDAEVPAEEDEQATAHMKNLETYMDTVQMQLDQINDAESYLKQAFGMSDEEYRAWEEEEEEEEQKTQPTAEQTQDNDTKEKEEQKNDTEDTAL